MKAITSKVVISVNMKKLQLSGITMKDFRRYVPRFITESHKFSCGWFEYFSLQFFRVVLISLTKLLLNPRNEKVGKLDIYEVERVYAREANTYNHKHHLTTRGMDTTWRRLAAWCVVSASRNLDKIKILDLCTGTGLTILEIEKLLNEWSIEADIIGLDFNRRMLDLARQTRFSTSNVSVRFAQGNAMKLFDDSPDNIEPVGFLPNSIDIVTQMFGIGGISQPLLVFQEVIRILKPGGHYFMMDMHQPIPNQPGEWPFFFKWLRSPIFESVAYNQSTIPVILNRLWGWRDTTSDFYFLPLTVWKDESSKYWGFEIINMSTESQRWWFSLPLMPTANIIVKKVEISEDEFRKRLNIFSSLTIV